MTTKHVSGTLKELEWEVTGWSSGDGVWGENDDEWRAPVHGHRYAAYAISWFGAGAFRLEDPDDNRTQHASLAAAKSAAQADYNARILAAIQPDPKPVTSETPMLSQAEPQPVATGRGRIVGSTTWTSKPLPEIKSSAGTVSVEAAAKVVAAYDLDYPMRTADQHRDDCCCLRCSVDALRALAGEDGR